MKGFVKEIRVKVYQYKEDMPKEITSSDYILSLEEDLFYYAVKGQLKVLKSEANILKELSENKMINVEEKSSDDKVQDDIHQDSDEVIDETKSDEVVDEIVEDIENEEKTVETTEEVVEEVVEKIDEEVIEELGEELEEKLPTIAFVTKDELSKILSGYINLDTFDDFKKKVEEDVKRIDSKKIVISAILANDDKLESKPEDTVEVASDEILDIE